MARTQRNKTKVAQSDDVANQYLVAKPDSMI